MLDNMSVDWTQTDSWYIITHYWLFLIKYMDSTCRKLFWIKKPKFCVHRLLNRLFTLFFILFSFYNAKTSGMMLKFCDNWDNYKYKMV